MSPPFVIIVAKCVLHEKNRVRKIFGEEKREKEKKKRKLEKSRAE